MHLAKSRPLSFGLALYLGREVSLILVSVIRHCFIILFPILSRSGAMRTQNKKSSPFCPNVAAAVQIGARVVKVG